MADDFYQILGVARDASPDEIKRAYYQRAQQHHPDKGGNEDAFKAVCQAYEVLSDPEKRALYDEHGMAAVGNRENQLKAAFTSILDKSAQTYGVQRLKEGFDKVASGLLKDLAAEERKLKQVKDCCRMARERIGEADDFGTAMLRVTIEGQESNVDKALRALAFQRGILEEVKAAGLSMAYRDDPQTAVVTPTGSSSTMTGAGSFITWTAT